MTPELALQLGRAVTFVAGRGKRHVPRVVIGKDTRLSGYMLEQAIASGVCAMGGRVMLCGPMPTPAIAHLTVSMRADAGIVISASHNPYQDNGIKVFGDDGFKLPDEAESRDRALHRRRSPAREALDRPRHRARAAKIEDARGRYVGVPQADLPARPLARRRPGGGRRRARRRLHGRARWSCSELGAQVTAIGVKPNGVNINKDAGALHPEHVAQRGRQARGRDRHRARRRRGPRHRRRREGPDRRRRPGDGDVRDARMASDEGTLRKKTVVATVMSNLGLEHALTRAGGKLVRTQVGDRYVVEAMRGRRLQPRRRAVRAPDLPRPRVHGRRHRRRAAGPRAHAPNGAAAVASSPSARCSGCPRCSRTSPSPRGGPSRTCGG